MLFYIVYTLAGISDVLDGWLARKMKIASEYGAKLDSIADLLFYVALMIKVFPELWIKLPLEIWIAVVAIFFLRMGSCWAAWTCGCFISLHTYMNRLTGVAVFLIPYIITLPVLIPFCVLVCVIACIATVEELVI